MRIIYTTLLFAHVLGVVVWVGGMFVLHFAVRPAAARLQEPAVRLTFLSSVLGRFMSWAALAIVVLLASGLAMIFIGGGFKNAHLSVHLMLAVGLVMMALYLHIRFAPFKRMRAAVMASELDGRRRESRRGAQDGVDQPRAWLHHHRNCDDWTRGVIAPVQLQQRRR